MVKKSIGFLLLLTSISFVIYIFFWPYDFQYTFTAKTTPGTVIQSLKLWSNTLKEAKVTPLDQTNEILQRITFSDTTYIFYWKGEMINDSVTKIKVQVQDPKHQYANRFKVPFITTHFKKRSEHTIRNFMRDLQQHLKQINITVRGTDTIPAQSCACMNFESMQTGKALQMMKGAPYLNQMLLKHRIISKGLPLLQVTRWNNDKDQIRFDFCYPIQARVDTLPAIENITYKLIQKKPALKATYNGNYITSDRAWYALLQYANNNGIQIDPLPTEIFFNNPNMGGDDRQWKAEIYMPLAN